MLSKPVMVHFVSRPSQFSSKQGTKHLKSKNASPPKANGARAHSPLASSSAARSKPDFLPAGWVIDVDAFKRAALKKQLLSARAIAQAAGIAQESVARVYRNEPVGLKTLLALAKA